MVEAERRTKADLAATALLTIAVVIVAAVLWHYGDARATTSQPAAREPAPLVDPAVLPPSLAKVWQAPSRATQSPVVAGYSVITADGGEVVGRDPLTGDVRWRYARDLRLCRVIAAWNSDDTSPEHPDVALAAYSKHPDYCSEVTALDGGTGRRVAQRNGDAEAGAALLFDGTHLTAAGTHYLETWRSDLVRTTQYGKITARVNPGKQPRSGCEYGSAAVASNRIALIERCPGEDSDRLTVLKANPKESEQPEPVYSVLIGTRGARVVALSSERVAVLLPGPVRLASYDNTGHQLAAWPLDINAPTASGRLEVPLTTVTPAAVYWYIGTATLALNPTDFAPGWTLPGTLGPGTLFAGQLLMPMPGELAVVDTRTGARIGGAPVARGSYHGPVLLATAGPVVLEQRGDLLVALR